jgi:hypothetical protein
LAGKYREILALEAKDRDSGLAFAMEIQWIACSAIQNMGHHN